MGRQPQQQPRAWAMKAAKKEAVGADRGPIPPAANRFVSPIL